MEDSTEGQSLCSFQIIIKYKKFNFGTLHKNIEKSYYINNIIKIFQLLCSFVSQWNSLSKHSIYSTLLHKNKIKQNRIIKIIRRDREIVFKKTLSFFKLTFFGSCLLSMTSASNLIQPLLPPGTKHFHCYIFFYIDSLINAFVS